MAIERYGSKTDIAVKLVLVFFVCLLSFSVGTFVGKKFSDNQHRLAQFEPSSHEREVASTETNAEHGENKSTNAGALSDEEIAKLAEEFVSDEESSVAKTEEPAHGETSTSAKSSAHATASRSVAAADEHAAPASPTSAAPQHAAPSPAAKTAAAPVTISPAASHSAPVSPVKPASETHAPAAVSVPAKAPASTPATHGTEKPTASAAKSATTSSLAEKVAASAVGKYTVQVGSYPSEAEASKRAEALKAEGFGAFYVRADVVDKKTNESKTWYRVSVGLFQTQKEADTYKADLMSRAKVSSALVQKITK